MGHLSTVPFKIENRNGKHRGYPCLFWFYNGLRYESLIDTGADNNLFPLQFLSLLISDGVVDIDKIYSENKFSRTAGVGGSVSMTHPIPVKIELKLDRSILIDLMVSFCIPDDKMAYDRYMTDQGKLSKIDNDFSTATDTRFKEKLANEHLRIQKNIQKFNPPFLFGKPFISKLDYVKFVIDNEMADRDSYFEFSVKDSCIGK